MQVPNRKGGRWKMERQNPNRHANLIRELQTPTQKATTTQEIYSQEIEEEQSQIEVTEADA